MKATPALLQLMAGKRVRARRAPKIRPREISLQISTANVLKAHCLPTWRYFHVPNGGPRSPRAGAMMKACGAIAGIPDFVLIDASGTAHFLELKRIGEPLSEPQEEFQTFCVRHGIEHSVCFNIDQVLKVFDHWKCLRIKIGGEA
jgi:hypothetical protein